MAENSHTMADLIQMQNLPLSIKISMTKRRIRDWVNHFGLDGVYISFSGGKDSTVLLTIAREMYPDIKAVFVDTGLEYPEIRQFVQTWDNVDVVRPKMTFKQVCEKYGFPLISKEISQIVGGGQKALAILKDDGIDIHDRKAVIDEARKRLKKQKGEWRHLAQCYGCVTKHNDIKYDINEDEKGKYSDIPQKWKHLLNAEFFLSHKCCNVMKKKPAHEYGKKTGRVPITAQMAEESRLRTAQWIKSGCNAFKSYTPVSNPMSFWTEQDIYEYIKKNNISIASVYGDIIVDEEKSSQVEGQMSLFDYIEMDEYECERPILKTTGERRTGCVLCGFGCHMEKKGDGRFERLKETHPKVLKALDTITNNGVTYRQAIDWINENNGKGEIIHY